MYTLNTPAKLVISKDSEGIIISQTIFNVVFALSRKGRTTFSASDIVHVINFNAKREAVTTKQVERSLKSIAKSYADGYKYHALRGTITTQDGYFFQYK